jgi:magnesium-protoporphyrin O-methyltransferase
MNCCSQCEGIEKTFDESAAKAELEDYRANGPANETLMLLKFLLECGVKDMTLLDIGGGVGAIQHELMQAGIARASHVDASSPYIEASKQEAKRKCYVERINYHQGDFVLLAPDIPAADIVTLDRVICCYHDMPSLVRLSSERARKFYALVFPRDAWPLRLGIRWINAFQRLRRDPMRFFVHRTADVEAIVRANGLTKQYHRKTFFWQILVYERLTTAH